jgi:hypothetical protein
MGMYNLGGPTGAASANPYMIMQPGTPGGPQPLGQPGPPGSSPQQLSAPGSTISAAQKQALVKALMGATSQDPNVGGVAATPIPPGMMG